MQLQYVQKCVNHIFDKFGKKESLDSLLRGPMKKIWQLSVTREIGRLAQGILNVQGNDAIDFITKQEVPSHKKVTYANMVCDCRPFKSDNTGYV